MKIQALKQFVVFCFKKCVSINGALKLNLISASVILTIGCSPQDAAAEPQADIFESSEFLKWEEESRAYYIRTSIGMAGLIIAQTNKADSKCIEDWYFGDEAAANAYIYKTMRQYPKYHPRGILLAVMEKKCDLSYD